MVWLQLVPFVMGLGLLLSVSTNLRMAAFPAEPGELLLAVLALGSTLVGKFWRFWKTPVVLFWLRASIGMLLGALLTAQKGALAGRRCMPGVATDLKMRIEFDLFYIEY